MVVSDWLDLSKRDRKIFRLLNVADDFMIWLWSAYHSTWKKVRGSTIGFRSSRNGYHDMGDAGWTIENHKLLFSFKHEWAGFCWFHLCSLPATLLNHALLLSSFWKRCWNGCTCATLHTHTHARTHTHTLFSQRCAKMHKGMHTFFSLFHLYHQKYGIWILRLWGKGGTCWGNQSSWILNLPSGLVETTH